MGGLFHKLRHPRRCYVVCTIPRSGSNLLTDGLRDTRRAGVPKQFFLPKAKSRYAEELGIDPAVDYAAYVRAIVNTKVTRNEVFGFKLMSWYLDDFLARLREAHGFGNSTPSDLELLRSAFPRLRFLRIVRRHKLRQACPRLAHFRQDFGKCRRAKAFCENRSSIGPNRAVTAQSGTRRKSGTIFSDGSESNRSTWSMKSCAGIMRGRFAQR